MAGYPNYYFSPYQAQMPQIQVPVAQGNIASAGSDAGIIWVQGEAGAKAYPVAAGRSLQLMDTEESVFYIKTVDPSGMPQPLRVFEYNERNALNRPVAPLANDTEKVTREEFDALREDVRRLSKNMKHVETKETGKNE